MSPHRHPTLERPIDPEQLRDELAAIWRRGRSSRPPGLAFPVSLSRTHQRNERRYAATDGRVIFVAPEILALPKANRRGLLAHECGHVVLKGREHTEDDADRVAAEVFGIFVRYDRRWPGKGLQKGKTR